MIREMRKMGKRKKRMMMMMMMMKESKRDKENEKDCAYISLHHTNLSYLGIVIQYDTYAINIQAHTTRKGRGLR